ncbi:MAG: aminopeptidase, partial [Sphingobacteriaceae bacterium]|nr:aminopeptidase [Sphingobacteriaceae bacterium]
MKNILTLIIAVFSLSCFAQDISYTQKTLVKLTSQKFWGRGYTKDGMAKAAEFIQSEFKSFGLQPMDGKDFKQNFTFSVNT